MVRFWEYEYGHRVFVCLLLSAPSQFCKCQRRAHDAFRSMSVAPEGPAVGQGSVRLMHASIIAGAVGLGRSIRFCLAFL